MKSLFIGFLGLFLSVGVFANEIQECRSLTGVYELNFGTMEFIQDGCGDVVNIERIIKAKTGKEYHTFYVLDGVRKTESNGESYYTHSWVNNKWKQEFEIYEAEQPAQYRMGFYYINENNDLVFQDSSPHNPKKIYKRLN